MGHAVLVVDDDVDLTDLLDEVLSQKGHTVEVAQNASIAAEKVRSFRPDFVLLDLSLGASDGFDLAPRLRSAVSKPFHLVAVTGWSDDKTRAAVRDAGFDSFLAKPLDLQKLDDILRVDEPET